MLRRLYEWTMAKAAHPRAEWWLAAFAFVEASFFPIPPHPLLGLMCLAEPKKAIRFAAIATAASVVGGLLGYAIGFFLFKAFGDQILAVLHVSRATFETASCHLRDYGPEIIMIKGATPIPFKLLTISAGVIVMSLPVFIGASIVSRSISFMIVGVLFRLFGAPIKAFIDKYLALVTAAFVVAVVGGFLALALLGGGSDETSGKCEVAAAAAA